MDFNLVDVIQNSISQINQDKSESNSEELISISEFCNRISSSKGINQSILLVEIVRAYLQNKFSITIKTDNEKVDNIFITAPCKMILLEPNFLFRFIEHLPEIIFLIDAIEGPANRLKGLTILMKEFENRNLFSFLNQAEIDGLEKICMMTIIHFYIKGEACPSIQEVCKFLPKSKYFQFLNRIENDTCMLIHQNLIKMSADNFRFEKGIKIQSRGIALMCNESISLI
jgi:hypothetical protein